MSDELDACQLDAFGSRHSNIRKDSPALFSPISCPIKDKDFTKILQREGDFSSEDLYGF